MFDLNVYPKSIEHCQYSCWCKQYREKLMGNS